MAGGQSLYTELLDINNATASWETYETVITNWDTKWGNSTLFAKNILSVVTIGEKVFGLGNESSIIEYYNEFNF